MIDWTPEPWEETQYGIRRKGIEDSYITRGGELISDARRIVACVNACAGIPTECLGDDDWKTLITGRKEREALRASLRDMVEYAEELKTRMEKTWDGYYRQELAQLKADIAKAKGLMR